MRGIKARAVAVAALGDLVPLYGAYALLFADAGLDTGAISALFVLWSLTTIVLEVPSGALADRVSRRQLLALAGLLRAAGFGLWVAAPSWPAFAAGFVLWGAADSLSSGAFEALLYDALVELRAAAGYSALLGRVTAAELLGVVAGTALAAPLLAAGGYRLVGAVSVAACIGQAGLALTLPEPARAAATGGYLGTLRAGLAEVTRHRPVRRAVLLTGGLAGLTAIDEYLPLLLRDAGVAVTVVPLWVAALPLAAAAGAALAGWRVLARPVVLALALGAGAVLVAAAGPIGSPAGMSAVLCWYGLVQLGQVAAAARLQDNIAGPARATVTSVAALGGELAAIGCFVVVGALWGLLPPVGLLLVVVVIPTVLVAAVLPRWMAPVRAGRR